jgi:PIN domain nuclease of toxin-antitoxin system
MMPVGNSYILDAYAEIAFLNREPGADAVAGLIQKAEDKEISLYDQHSGS